MDATDTVEVLRTERLRLRVMRQDDRDALLRIFGDPQAMTHFTSTMTPEQVGMLIARHQLRHAESGRALWAVELAATGEVIGDCGIIVQEIEGTLEDELGYHFAPAHWGNGYATEAALGVLDHAHTRLGLSRAVSLIRAENEPSWRVSQRVGMSFEKDVVHADLPHQLWSRTLP